MRKLIITVAIFPMIFLEIPAAMAESGTPVSITEGTYRSISPAELSEILASKDFFLVRPYPSASEKPAAKIPQPCPCNLQQNTDTEPKNDSVEARLCFK